MSMGRIASDGAKERIEQLCSEFKLPTVGAEAVPRFAAAGHADALVTLVEVLEQEAEDRGFRREPARDTWRGFLQGHPEGSVGVPRGRESSLTSTM